MIDALSSKESCPMVVLLSKLGSAIAFILEVVSLVLLLNG
jgi:hypothetical protein